MKFNAQKVWSVTWKTLVGLVLVMMLFVGCVVLNAYFHSDMFKNRRWCRRPVTYTMWHADSFQVKNAYRYVRTVDIHTGKPLTPKLKMILPGIGDDSLAVIMDMQDRWGYLDIRTGKIAIEGRYEFAGSFYEGLAAVVQNNRLGFIDHDGNWVIEPQFGFLDKYHTYSFRNGYCWATNRQGEFGIIDKQGRWVLEPNYTNIRPVRHGYYVLEQDEIHFGLADSCGQIVLPCEYEAVEVRAEGVILQAGGRKWMLSPNLKEVVHPFIIDEENTLSVATDEVDPYGYARYSDYEPIGTYRVGLGIGLLDRHTGQPLTLAIYDGIQYISPNLFRCTLNNSPNAPAILVNANGEEVRP